FNRWPVLPLATQLPILLSRRPIRASPVTHAKKLAELISRCLIHNNNPAAEPKAQTQLRQQPCPLSQLSLLLPPQPLPPLPARQQLLPRLKLQPLPRLQPCPQPLATLHLAHLHLAHLHLAAVAWCARNERESPVRVAQPLRLSTGNLETWYQGTCAHRAPR
ncbi:hypothetical protein GGR58DRAFT_221275, partial [Xylaria digitata]